MEFATIAVGIGRDAACGRQAMPMAGYAYADEIYSSKSQKSKAGWSKQNPH
ncbi:hypothetical protein [Nostoc sp. 'Lobaria pulmonaria (5183) cyanobiont']|uniref:hypothetical protein n=1 Tax=Nostoc sp. 'Lobaria pulmonaria (5183) cyanobiont' TaxID=1618022 RepID=UPI001319FBA8|nr:hypothetical protein [Nostoc sp. 'Lobaria pulmonaria (5183) cyanobiont']